MAGVLLLSQQAADNLHQAFSSMWIEFGSELVLLALFCAGFLLFRLPLLRRMIGADAPRRRLPKVVDAGPCSEVHSAPPCNVRGGALKRQGIGRETAPVSAAEGRKLLFRLQAAVAAGSAEQVLMRLSEAAQALAQVPDEVMVSVVRLVTPLLSGERPASLDTAAAGSLVEFTGRTGDVAALEEVCRAAAAQGLALPAAPCRALLRGCAAAGEAAGVRVFDALAAGGLRPPEGALVAVVCNCADSRHVRLAERLLAHVRETHGSASCAFYAAMMKVYSQARMWHRACDLYETMRRDGVKPDNVLYGSLIKAAVESGRADLARKLFEESGNPDVMNYMSLIRVAGREGDVPRALQLLDELERSPLTVDMAAYNCALEACAVCNDRANAEGLFERMRRAGRLDVVSYNTLLKILLAAGARGEVGEALRMMQAQGLAPNAVTYNSLIKDAIAQQDTQRAWLFVEKMERARVGPDAFTCSILMKAVKHDLCPEQVDRVIALVRRVDVRPDEVLVNVLLDACVRLKDPRRLGEVLDSFKATGFVPSAHAYATLIRAYGHARRLDRSWAIWREVSEESSNVPSEELFSAMMEACHACGDVGGAAALFRELGVRLSTFSRAAPAFATFVKACVQHKQASLAAGVYVEIKDFIVCSKVCFNSLIDIFARQGDMLGANQIFRDMTVKNVTPDLITYTTLIKGHCMLGDLEHGLQLLGLMQRRGISPDSVLYNSLLDGCANKQMRSLTEQVLRDMEAAGIAPSNYTLSILIKLYGRCGDVDAAFEAVEAYPSKYGFKPNAQVLTCLMSSSISNGELGKALEVYENLGARGCAPDAKMYQTLFSGCLRTGDATTAVRLLDDAWRAGLAPRLDAEVADAALRLAGRAGLVAEAAPIARGFLAAGAHVSDRTLALLGQ